MQVKATHQIGGTHLTAVKGPVPLTIGLYPVAMDGSEETYPAIIIRGISDGLPGANPPHSGTAEAMQGLHDACVSDYIYRFAGADKFSLVLVGDIRAAWRAIAHQFPGQPLSRDINDFLPRYERRIAGPNKYLDVGMEPFELAKALVLEVSGPVRRQDHRVPVRKPALERRLVRAGVA
ncbi:MAG: hypothetical protein HY053_01305 [Proteobacteria bacterium]|nr:hypothetical protein [Pseudomonadota bacterium]